MHLWDETHELSAEDSEDNEAKSTGPEIRRNLIAVLNWRHFWGGCTEDFARLGPPKTLVIDGGCD